MRNITVLLLACLFLGGCGSDKEQKSDSSAISPVFESLNQSTQNILSQVSETASKAIEKADEISKDISLQAGNISEIVAKSADDVKKVTDEVVNSAVEIAKEASQKAGEVAEQAVQKAENIAQAAKEATTQSDNGKKVFAKCIVCHGKAANLKALNSSQDISNWSKENIVEALSGYKGGTYGGKMKASMAPIVKPLSESDINDVAGYIQTLGK
ncbi:MAG: cytochrome c [Campylobacteraceae bacterium]|nr:cytochrome c [Campylobacteraceae bacterium]